VESLVAVTTGVLFGASVYLILRRDLVRVVIGFALLTNAVNLVLFAAGGLTRFNPPLVRTGELTPEVPFANPLPQALILTAIVIGFGLIAFTLVLVYRAHTRFQTLDPDEVRVAEPSEASRSTPEAARELEVIP
jgi:multicomponent Na+:H+ antiporter subunit C